MVLAKNCKTCGKKMNDSRITHCSEKCLFASIWNSKSISGTPIENWDDLDPWL